VPGVLRHADEPEMRVGEMRTRGLDREIRVRAAHRLVLAVRRKDYTLAFTAENPR